MVCSSSMASTMLKCTQILMDLQPLMWNSCESTLIDVLVML